jgi:parallel beta-helix repeat protein
MKTPNLFWAVMLLPLLGAGWLPCSAQNTIHVPADASTIQAGIDAAKNGDIVLVSPGTYTENINFNGKAITVTSGATTAAGSAFTIIQGATNGSIVTFQNNEPASAVLNGFTIQDAFGSEQLAINSNGVDILGASPTITNNTIWNNIGCGILLAGAASPLIQSNLISNNRSPASNEPEYRGCGAAGGLNEAGAAIAVVSAGQAQIISNLIEDNSCDYQPCGLFISGGNEVLLESNTIINSGGAVQADAAGNSYLTTKIFLIQNLIYSFEDVQDLLLQGTYTSTPTAANAPTFIGTNNTFYNTNVGLGSVFLPSTADNNVFVQTYFGPNGNSINPYTLLSCGGTPTTRIDYLTIDNNDFYAENYPQAFGVCPPTSNNLTSDPQFFNDNSANPNSWNFRVQRTSPVIAAGDINAPMIPAVDLDGKNRTVCGTIDMGAYEKHPIPPVSLTSSPNPSVGGTTVIFPIHVQGNCNIPTGILTILDGQTSIGIVTLDATGNATFSTAALFVGTHTITATYPGDFNFDPSVSNVVTQVVTGAPSQTSIQVSPNPGVAFQAITFSATVGGNLGTPTGPVTFYSGNQALTTVQLNGSGIAIATLNTLGAGTYQITGVYNASVDYQGSSSVAVSLIVNGATTTTTFSSAPNASTFGQLVTFTAVVTASQSTAIPTGTVMFQEGGTPLGSGVLSTTGIATLSISTLAVGSHTVTAYYGASSSDNASTSNPVVQVVNPAQTSVSLTGRPNPAAVGQTVTLVATISAANGMPASGTVAFSDQFGAIGNAPIVAGQASFATSTLTGGTHNIVAAYAASGGYGAAASIVLVEVIQTFDFSITLSPATLSLASGSVGTLAVQVQGVGNLAGNVILSAAPIPEYGSVSFDPAAVQFPSGGLGRSVLSIKTTQLPPPGSLEGRMDTHDRTLVGLLATFSVLPLFFVGGRRKLREHKALALLCAVGASLALTTLSGCTTLYTTLNRVAPGTYTIPVTGVDQTSQISHTATLTLTVTP